MESTSLKIKNFFKRKRNYFIVFGIFFVLYNIFLLVSGAWPYGNNVPFVSDAYQQIVVLFEYFFKVLKGEQSLFYASSLGGGLTIFSTLQYMFSNPFYLIALIFGEANYEIGLEFSFFFMLLFNMLVFMWFQRKHYGGLNSFLSVLLALCFGFSGFIIQNTSFISWATFPGIAIILIEQFLKLVNDGKILGFTIVTIWYVINCYSTGISTTIILLVLFVAYIYFIKEKQDRKPIYLRLFVSYVIAVAVCIILLFPSIMDFFSTERSSFLYNLLVYKQTGVLRKIATLLCDGLIIVFAVIWLIKCNKKEKINKFYIFAFIFLLFPTLFDAVQKLLCGSMYVAFVSRFYFLTDIFIFNLACKFFIDKPVALENEKTSKGAATLFGMVVAFVTIFAVVYIIIMIDNIGIAFKTQIIEKFSVVAISASVFFSVLLIAVATWLLNKRKMFSKRAVEISISFLMIFCLSFNFLTFVGGSAQDDETRQSVYNLTSSNSVSSVKYFQGQISTGSYDFLGADNFNVFSSMIPKENKEFYLSLGYQYSISAIEGYGSTIISDVLIGVEYYITDKEIDRPYLTFVDSENGIYLYKNELSTSGAIILSDIIDFGDGTYKDIYNALKEYFNIDGTLFESIKLSDFAETEQVVDEDNVYKLTYTATKSGILYVEGALTTEDENDYELDTLCLTEVGDDFCQDIVYLEAGETYSFYLTGVDDAENLSFLFMDYFVATEIISNLQECQVSLSTTKLGYEIEFTAETNGYVYIFKPIVNGMTYTVNGEEVLTVENFTLMPVISVSAGNISITAKYSYPYTSAWLIITAILVVLVCLIIVLYKFGKLRFLESPITIAFYVLICIILVFFYALGFLLSFWGISL